MRAPPTKHPIDSYTDTGLESLLDDLVSSLTARTNSGTMRPPPNDPLDGEPPPKNARYYGKHTEKERAVRIVLGAIRGRQLAPQSDVRTREVTRYVHRVADGRARKGKTPSSSKRSRSVNKSMGISVAKVSTRNTRFQQQLIRRRRTAATRLNRVEGDATFQSTIRGSEKSATRRDDIAVCTDRDGARTVEEHAAAAGLDVVKVEDGEVEAERMRHGNDTVVFGVSDGPKEQAECVKDLFKTLGGEVNLPPSMRALYSLCPEQLATRKDFHAEANKRFRSVDEKSLHRIMNVVTKSGMPKKITDRTRDQDPDADALPEVRVLTRETIEQNLRTPFPSERPCVNGDNCEGRKIPTTTPVVLKEFPPRWAMESYAKSGLWPDKRFQCLMCEREQTNFAYYLAQASCRSILNNVQISDMCCIEGPGEYSARSVLASTSRSYLGVTRPVLMHVVSWYTQETRDGVVYFRETGYPKPDPLSGQYFAGGSGSTKARTESAQSSTLKTQIPRRQTSAHTSAT